MTYETAAAPAKEEDAAILLQGEIADAITAEIGLKPEMANGWAHLITGYLRRRLGAQQLYIPAPSKADRDAAIYRDYNGSNAGEVCERYGVSRSRMHEIVAEQRQQAIERGRQYAGVSPVSSLKTGRPGG